MEGGNVDDCDKPQEEAVIPDMSDSDDEGIKDTGNEYVEN